MTQYHNTSCGKLCFVKMCFCIGADKCNDISCPLIKEQKKEDTIIKNNSLQVFSGTVLRLGDFGVKLEITCFEIEKFPIKRMFIENPYGELLDVSEDIVVTDKGMHYLTKFGDINHSGLWVFFGAVENNEEILHSTPQQFLVE